MLKNIFSLVLSISLLLCLPAQAQKFHPKAITFVGASEYSDAEILRAAGLQKGQDITSEEMSAVTQRLLDTQLFVSASYRFDGVNLVYKLEPVKELYRVNMDNIPLVLDDALWARLREQVPLLHDRVPFQGGIEEGLCHALEAIFKERGMEVKISGIPSTGPLSKSWVVDSVGLHIDSPAVKWGKVVGNGVSDEMRPKLAIALQKAFQSPFSNNTANVKKLIEDFYTDADHPRRVVQVEPGMDFDYVNDEIRVPMKLRVDEGRLYRMGSALLPANSVMHQGEADDILHGVKRSEVRGGIPVVAKGGAVYPNSNQSNVQLLNYEVNQRYHASGYIKCKVVVLPEFDEALGKVNYRVNVESGDLHRMGKVSFANVSEELRDRLMRYWEIKPGEAFNDIYAEGFLIRVRAKDAELKRSLENTGAQVNTQIDPVTHVVDLVIRVVRR